MRRVALRIRMGVMAISVCGGVASALGAQAAATNQAQQLDVLDLPTILRRLGQRYAAMGVYRDRGVSIVRSSRYPELNTTQRFATEFERSRHFSWVSDLGKKDDYRITFNGVRVVEQFYGRRKEVPTLGEAIAGATGISNVAATWIPTLLMPDVLPGVGLLPAFRRASSPARLPDEEAGGQQCFVLQAQDIRLQVRVWISRRDFLVRRVEHRSEGRDVVTTTDYTPQTDISLGP
ncbi:MAG: hypothetical protein ABL982_03290, partial [Vicinamibacterales bacterium]